MVLTSAGYAAPASSRVPVLIGRPRNATSCPASNIVRMKPEGIAKLFSHTDLATGGCMKIPSAMPRLKGYHHPREIIYAVWAYHRFALSTADVEDLLSERGVIISRETIQLWINRFGAHFAACIRRDRPRPNDRRDDERRSWGGSSRHGKRSASSPHMTRSTISSALAVTAFPPHHTVMLGQMHSVSGLTMPPK